MPLRVEVCYVGNFLPSQSTETHVKQAWESEGHTVATVQEEVVSDWENLISNPGRYDLILWTSTGGLAEKIGTERQWRMITAAKKAGVPTVALHLDRWWGLSREAQVWERPFFRCDFVITADGGHQKEFTSVGVNHFWLPPAVSLPETELGRHRNGYDSELAFVGSWQSGYHKEWAHRPELVNWLTRKYRNRIKFWPQPGQHAIRGKDLRDLYASAQVVIGDSCLVGNATSYISDRVPETIGRGGFLIHPHVEGVTDGTHYTAGEHLVTWQIGEWSALKMSIDRALADPGFRERVSKAGREHVIKHHTYNTRVGQILEIVK